MAKKTRAQRRAERRAKVLRSERVMPPPEAAAHKRPWPLMELLHLGPEGFGIDADEFEAALQIVEAFKVLTAQLEVRHPDLLREHLAATAWREMSDKDAERCALWFTWSTRLPRSLPPRLVAWIEDDQSIGSVAILRHACRLWARTRADIQHIDKAAPSVLTMPPEDSCPNEPIDAKAGFLTATWCPPESGTFPHPVAPPLSAAHACHASTLNRALPDHRRR